MDRVKKGATLTDTYWSWEEFIEAVTSPSEHQEWIKNLSSSTQWRGGKPGQEFSELMADVMEWAKHGWPEGIQGALEIARSAVKTVDAERQQDTVRAEWLMTGAEVDIGRYLQGVPECMIEYEQIKVSKVGRVVTVVASVGALSNFTPEQILRRGATVVALIMALEETNHSVELWLDSTASSGGRSKKTGAIRVLLKSATDMLDPGKIAFALGHPSVLRVLVFMGRFLFPTEWKQVMGIPPYGSHMGASKDPAQDMADGTIYLPCLGQGRNPVLDAERYVVEVLRDLELLS